MKNSKNAHLQASPNQILLALYEASYDRVFQTPTLDYLHCGLSDIADTHQDKLNICHNQIRRLFLPLTASIYKEAATDGFLKKYHRQLIVLWEKVNLYLQEGPYASDEPELDKPYLPYEAVIQSCLQIKKIVEPLELIHFEASLTKQSSLVHLLNTWLSNFAIDKQDANASLP